MELQAQGTVTLEGVVTRAGFRAREAQGVQLRTPRRLIEWAKRPVHLGWLQRTLVKCRFPGTQ